MVLHLAVALLATLTFGESDPPAKPPGMGESAGEMQEISEPGGLREMIDSDVVSLIMFTESSEDDNESNWFMLFQMMVERSISLQNGDARVNWAKVDNEMLRSRGSWLFRPAGIWLFADASDKSGVRLPMSVQSEAAVREAGEFILGALGAAGAQNVKGTWRKASVKSEL